MIEGTAQQRQEYSVQVEEEWAVRLETFIGAQWGSAQ